MDNADPVGQQDAVAAPHAVEMGRYPSALATHTNRSKEQGMGDSGSIYEKGLRMVALRDR